MQIMAVQTRSKQVEEISENYEKNKGGHMPEEETPVPIRRQKRKRQNSTPPIFEPRINCNPHHRMERQNV